MHSTLTKSHTYKDAMPNATSSVCLSLSSDDLRMEMSFSLSSNLSLPSGLMWSGLEVEVTSDNLFAKPSHVVVQFVTTTLRSVKQSCWV